jgi:protein-tyrosine phosphatase
LEQTKLRMVDIAGGKISVGPRPRLKLLKEFKQSGISHIWTLLSEHEGATDIEKAARKNALQWVWLPLANGKPPEQTSLDEIQQCFAQCQRLLSEGAQIYLHCSAGIHRTGMIAYAFCRFLGLSRAEALHIVEQLRTVTAEGVTEHRLAWGDSNFGQKE